jgi:adenylate kinase family enzyme
MDDLVYWELKTNDIAQTKFLIDFHTTEDQFIETKKASENPAMIRMLEKRKKSINIRFKVYEERVQPIIEHFKAQPGGYNMVDINLPVDQVFQELCNIISSRDACGDPSNAPCQE